MRNITGTVQTWTADRIDRIRRDAGAMSVEWVGIVALLLIITGLTIEALSDDGFLGVGRNVGDQIGGVISDWIAQFEPSGRTE